MSPPSQLTIGPGQFVEPDSASRCLPLPPSLRRHSSRLHPCHRSSRITSAVQRLRYPTLRTTQDVSDTSVRVMKHALIICILMLLHLISESGTGMDTPWLRSRDPFPGIQMISKSYNKIPPGHLIIFCCSRGILCVGTKVVQVMMRVF